MYRYREIYLDRVLAPEGEILFFAQPKKSIQKKSCPLPRISCVPQFCRGLAKGMSLFLCQRAASLPHPFGLFPSKLAVLGAAKEKFDLLLARLHCETLICLAFYVCCCRRQRSEQYLTESQSRDHFFRQVKGFSQTGQIFWGSVGLRCFGKGEGLLLR
jgi:hypothetical protein